MSFDNIDSHKFAYTSKLSQMEKLSSTGNKIFSNKLLNSQNSTLLQKHQAEGKNSSNLKSKSINFHDVNDKIIILNKIWSHSDLKSPMNKINKQTTSDNKTFDIFKAQSNIFNKNIIAKPSKNYIYNLLANERERLSLLHTKNNSTNKNINNRNLFAAKASIKQSDYEKIELKGIRNIVLDNKPISSNKRFDIFPVNYTNKDQDFKYHLNKQTKPFT